MGRLEIEAVVDRDFWATDGLDEMDCVLCKVGDEGDNGPFPIVALEAWLNAV